MTRPSEMAFRHCTEDYFKYLKASELSFKIEDITKVFPTTLWPDHAGVRVVIAATSPDGTKRKEGQLYFMNEDGDWKLSQVQSTLLFPRRPVPKVPTPQFSRYIAMYPGVKFSAITTYIWAFGQLKGVSRRRLAGIEGTTSDDFIKIYDFYKKELQENWQDYEETSSSHGRASRNRFLKASAVRTSPDGKRIGVTVHVAKKMPMPVDRRAGKAAIRAYQRAIREGKDFEIKIVMGFLPAGARISKPGSRPVSPKAKPKHPVPGVRKRPGRTGASGRRRR